MTQKKQRIVTYRDRGRAHSGLFGLAGLALLIAGVVLGVTTGNWWVTLLAVVAVLCAYGMFRSNERVHRDNP